MGKSPRDGLSDLNRNICQLLFLAYCTIFYYFLNLSPKKKLYMEIYVITLVTIFLQQRQIYNFVQKGRITTI
jgi:hypothetical protein